MQKMYVIGVDLGGTKILTALANLQGEIIQRVRVATAANEPANEVVKRIIDTVWQVIKDAQIKKDEVLRIGIGSPGPLDLERGIVLFSPNLKWSNVAIVHLMESALKIPVVLENDANAAALAEYHFGAGQGANPVVYMTISTGIGGGVIINGQILHGYNNNAGEIGHHTIIADGPICGCGNRGCLEALASGTALGRYGREAVEQGLETMISDLVSEPQEIDGSIVTKAAYAGDRVALEITKKVATYIGIGLANMVNIFNPQIIVLGGGVTKAGDLLIETIKQTVAERALKASAQDCQITFAELGSDVGVLGAIAVALNK